MENVLNLTLEIYIFLCLDTLSYYINVHSNTTQVGILYRYTMCYNRKRMR